MGRLGMGAGRMGARESAESSTELPGPDQLTRVEGLIPEHNFLFPSVGVYKVTPRSCHRFEQAFYTYDTYA